MMSLRFLIKRQRNYKKLFPFFLCVLLVAGVLMLIGKAGVFFSGDSEIKLKEDTVRVKVWHHETQTLLEMGLEQYVTGVVAAEMPASFALEALKAQAVAARTYAVKRLLVPDPRVKNFNKEADLSSDPAVNQAWISTAEMMKRWGKWNYSANKKKIVQAVEETRGKVLIYKGQLIDPAYHASCGGKGTENSGQVWKFDLPYLKQVSCTGHADRHQAEALFFSFKKLDTLLGTTLHSLPASKIAQGRAILSIAEKSSSGRVCAATVGGKNFSGAELRTKLELPSTRFTWQIKEGGVQIETNGYGHGVGMCQYGAADLAQQGKTYQEILKHYYTGVKMANIK